MNRRYLKADRTRLYLQPFDDLVHGGSALCEALVHFFINPPEQEAARQAVVLYLAEEELRKQIDG